jgi:hypothetical protein
MQKLKWHDLLSDRNFMQRKFTERWVPHELTPASKAKRVKDARTLFAGAEKRLREAFCTYYDGRREVVLPSL